MHGRPIRVQRSGLPSRPCWHAGLARPEPLLSGLSVVHLANEISGQADLRGELVWSCSSGCFELVDLASIPLASLTTISQTPGDA